MMGMRRRWGYVFYVRGLLQASGRRREGNRVAQQVVKLGGRFDYREEPPERGRGGICLTFEFDDLDAAQRAAAKLREQGEYIEGPAEYGA